MVEQTMNAGGYQVDILVQGYPGKTVQHGGLGWSTVALLRGHGRVVVLDTGSFGVRRRIADGLAQFGLRPSDVTDLILSHLHYDHIVNWPMFTGARMVVGAKELADALAEPPGSFLFPECYIESLARHPKLQTIGEGDKVLPNVTAHMAAGHTTGHLMFVIEGDEHDIILVQDSAKYRSELLTRRADMTIDPAVTAATIERIWTVWRRKPNSIVLPGHDLPMVLKDDQPTPIGRHQAGIIAIFGDTIDDRTTFPLAPL
jgi:N-acyl homoserine lactone hydrolase